MNWTWVGWIPWAPKLADATCWLLAKYHSHWRMGCTKFMEHMIKVTDDTPFKEWFRQIPPPLVEEVWNHLWKILESGTIWPSQSAWCNVVVLVRKKDGSLQFCIDFHCLNTCMKKDSHPLPRIQEALESLVGAGHFSCLDLKLGFWQIKMEEASKQYTAITVGNLGFFECNHMPFGLSNVLATLQQLIQNCLGKLNLIYCLIYPTRLNGILADCRGTTSTNCTLCLTTSGSTISNWNHQSVVFLRKR